MPFMVVEKIKLDRVTALMTAGDLAAAGEQLMSIHHAILSLLREREDLLPCQCITCTLVLRHRVLAERLICIPLIPVMSIGGEVWIFASIVGVQSLFQGTLALPAGHF